MKKCFVLFLFIYVTACSAFATPVLKASLTYATFNTPNKGPYIETYISVIGNTVKFVKNGKGKYQGDVSIAINFSINNEIKNALKYNLSSPETEDTMKGYPNFIDQQRFALPNGKYTMQISIGDKNNSSVAPFVSSFPIEINLSSDSISISDVQFLETYTKSTNPSIITKSGYDLVPYVSGFYPENIKQIKFYVEIYNSKKILGEGEKMLVSYSIQTNQSNSKLNNFSGFSKQTSNDVAILLNELNIESLPSGNYNFIVEVRDKNNKIRATRECFFQRKNKLTALAFEDLKSIDISSTFVKDYKSIDTLHGYIRSLRPISSPSEVQYEENQMKGKDLLLMQQFFYNFWKSRNEVQPETAWKDYNEEVRKVNKEFGTFGLKGYDTDRGRIFLQYGAPTLRGKYENEPSTYPYEIWQYDALVDKTQLFNNPNNRQSNKKFVFANSDLSSNRFVLIHSTAKGEITNARWQLLLYNRNMSNSNIDAEKAPDNFGSNIDDNFNNPR